jgi:hypothetical protein
VTHHNGRGSVSCCKQLPQIPSRETERALLSDLSRWRLRQNDCQLLPEFPDSEAAGNALFANPVETRFIAV